MQFRALKNIVAFPTSLKEKFPFDRKNVPCVRLVASRKLESVLESLESFVKWLEILQMLVILQVWIKNSSAAATGRYRASGNEGNPQKLSLDSKLDFSSNLSSENTLKGKYVPDEDKWAYRPDNRGKYVHIHVPALPYNGTVAIH